MNEACLMRGERGVGDSTLNDKTVHENNNGYVKKVCRDRLSISCKANSEGSGTEERRKGNKAAKNETKI